MSNSVHVNDYLSVIYCFEQALSAKYLGRKFSSKDLIKRLKFVTDFFGEIFLNNETLAVYVQLVIHLASATNEMKGPAEAAWQFRKRVTLLDKF